MDTDAKGQLGGIECSKDARERMAKDSGKWACAACGKSNHGIMEQREEAVRELEEKEGGRKEEEVPEELRLAYRDELGKSDEGQTEKADKGKGKAVESVVQQEASSPPETSAPAVSSPDVVPAIQSAPTPRPTRTTQAPPLQHMVQQSPDRSLAWIDTCIWGIVAMLLFLVLKKFAI